MPWPPILQHIFNRVIYLLLYCPLQYVLNIMAGNTEAPRALAAMFDEWMYLLGAFILSCFWSC